MNFIEKIKKILSSRTNWTIVVMFVVGGVEAITAFIPTESLPYIEGLLALLAMYFRSHPKVDFE